MDERTIIGSTEDGHTMRVSVRLERQPGGETVDHVTVGPFERLSVTGEVYERGVCIGGGQNVDDLVGATFEGVDVEDLRRTWERWHLNDLRAGCSHQSVVWEDSPYGRRPSLDLTEPCPVTGYRYGSAWLVEPLPVDVLAKVRRFIDSGEWGTGQ